jgi:hypothetical protein
MQWRARGALAMSPDGPLQLLVMRRELRARIKHHWNLPQVFYTPVAGVALDRLINRLDIHDPDRNCVADRQPRVFRRSRDSDEAA